jgi:hypothetical protein
MCRPVDRLLWQPNLPDDRTAGFPATIRTCKTAEGEFEWLPMQSHEILREVFQECSPKQVAAELNLSLSMIYKWAEPPDEAAGSGSTNPLDRIDALLRCTKDRRLVQWICQRGGGFFILNPKTNKPHPSYLIPATNSIVQEFADLLAVIASAAADNHITLKEAQQIRARWEELKSVTEHFVACCEEGNFAPLKEKSAALLSHPSLDQKQL